MLALPSIAGRRSADAQSTSWAGALLDGITEAEHAVLHPSWRLLGAIGYLANLIPVPGAVGVLEGGLAGTLILYGAPAVQVTAGVLIYHAVAFWIASVGGLFAYRQLQRELL